MAFAQIETLRGQGGTIIALATPPQFYAGPYAGSGYKRITAGQDETIAYGLPWKNDDSGLTYYNRSLAGDEYVDLTARGATVLNDLVVNGGKTLTFTLKNGYKIKCQNANPQFSFVDPNNGVVTQGNILSATNSYVSYLAVIMDFDAHEAKIGYYFFTPSFTGSGNVGWKFPPDQNTQSTRQAIYTALIANMPPVDPYVAGGTSTGTSEGTGTFDDTSESVPLPLSYTLTPTASGLMTQYVMTGVELQTLGAWLWNGGTVLDDLKRVFQSPSDAIFSIGILPFTPSDTTDYNVWIGGLNPSVTGKKINTTIEHISMGSITFDPYYGSALDQNPYTKCEIYLPYCGNFPLNVDEIMGHEISVDYYCDTTTGDCVAFISDEDRVLEQVRGNCFVQIPLSARDFTGVYSSALGAVATVAAGLASAAVTGGMTAPIAVGMGTSMAANAMNAKTHIAKMGGISGMAGLMAIQTPYVILTIPNQCLPEMTRDHQGYPLMITKRLGDFVGFTKVYEIHLEELDATDAEAKEIYDLLKGGVII